MRGLICPICDQALRACNSGKTLHCSSGHSYDIAKQGYVNLMLSHKKKSKSPGDSAEMVLARQAFLNKGYYEPFAGFLIDCLRQDLDLSESSSGTYYLDIGCGEGYYTQRIHEHIFSSNESPSETTTSFKRLSTGVDISTPAIKAASRRSKTVQWVVASAKSLPVPANSCDLISVLFCRVDLNEALRALKPGGHLLVASTGQEHLIEMREKLYDEVKESSAFPAPQIESGFEVHSHRQFHHLFTLRDAETLQQLLMMTPHFWRTKENQKQKLLASLPISLTMDIDVLMLRKLA